MMRPWPMIFGSVLAATVAIGCLIFAFSDGRIVSPFGWNRVVVVHGVSSLPLAFVVAGLLCRARLSSDAKPVAVLLASVWIVLAVVITVFGGVFIAHLLNVSEAGFTVRMAVRSVWTLVLETPCFWLVLLLVRPIRMPRRAFGHLMIWSVAVVLLIPFGFVVTLNKKQTDLAKVSWQTFRIDKAVEKVDRLCAVGSMAGFGVQESPETREVSDTSEVTARQAQAALMKNASLLIEGVQSLRKQELTEENRLTLSRYLRSLGELEEAVTLLEPIADRMPEAAVMLGRVFQAKNEWAASSKWFQSAVDQLLAADRPEGSRMPDESIPLFHQAYDCLAQNAREMLRYDDAERYYLAAIEQIPSDAAYFHYQLVRHYDLSGRIRNSLLHHQLAHELAPARYASPPPWLQKFFSSSTPVGILAPSQSNY